MQKRTTIPTFAKVNVSIRNGTYKLKRKIARLVMETELQNKHRQKRKLRKDILSINVLLSTSLSVIVYNALLHQINIAVKSQFKLSNCDREKNLITWNWNKKQPTTLMNVNNPTLNTPYIISHFTLCHVIHHSFIWSWSSYPNKIKRCCYWGRIRTVFPRFIEKLNTYTGQWLNIVKNQTKKYLRKLQ